MYLQSISGVSFKQSTMEALFKRVPVNTSEAVRKFTATSTSQSDRKLQVPMLKGSPIDIRA